MAGELCGVDEVSGGSRGVPRGSEGDEGEGGKERAERAEG